MTQPTINVGAIQSPKLGHIPTLWNSKFCRLISKVPGCNSCYRTVGSASCQSAVYKSSIPCLNSGRWAILQERTLRAVKIQCWLTLQVEVLTVKGRDKEGKGYKQQGGTEISELQCSREAIGYKYGVQSWVRRPGRWEPRFKIAVYEGKVIEKADALFLLCY